MSSNLLFSSFALSSIKTLDVFISRKNEVIIQLVTNCPNNTRRSLVIRPSDIQSIFNLKHEIAEFLNNSNESGEICEVLNHGENGETRLVSSVFNEQTYISIRYFNTTNDKVVPTKYGITLNYKEVVQLFVILPNVVSYIESIQKYANTAREYFSAVVEGLLYTAVPIYKATVLCESGNFPEFESYLTTYYTELCGKLDVNHIISIALTKLRVLEITPLNQSDSVALVNLLIFKEKRSLCSCAAKEYSENILKSIVGTSSSNSDTASVQ